MFNLIYRHCTLFLNVICYLCTDTPPLLSQQCIFDLVWLIFRCSFWLSFRHLITHNQSLPYSTDFMPTLCGAPFPMNALMLIQKDTRDKLHTHYKGNFGGYRPRFTSSFLTNRLDLKSRTIYKDSSESFLHHCNQRNTRDLQNECFFPIYEHHTHLNWSCFSCNNPTMTTLWLRAKH